MPKVARSRSNKASLIARRNTINRGSLIAVVALVVTAAGYLAVHFSHAATVCTVSDKLVNSCRPWLGGRAGVYPQVAATVRAQQDYMEQRVGRQMDVIHTYNQPGDVLDSTEVYYAKRAGTYLFANWKPAGNWAAGSDASNATTNADIDKMAASIKALGSKKMFMTIWHEPQNDVSGGSANCGSGYNYVGSAGTPAQYRAMWANVENRFSADGVDNVVWVIDFQNQTKFWCMVNELYPGDNLVDWVMSNGYGSPSQQSFSKNVGEFYNFFTSNSNAQHDYLSKPWGIVEWNIHNSTTAQGVNYYTQAKAALDANTFPKLKDWMIFDSIGPDGNDNRVAYDYKTDSSGANVSSFSQAKQDGFNIFAADSRFTDAFYAGVTTPTPTQTPTPTPIPTTAGDFNGDGKVNVTDLSALLSHWASSDVNTDLNHDGIVNVLDLSILLSHWTG